MAENVNLPAGFVLDEPAQTQGGLPPGFQLDQPEEPGLIDKAIGAGETALTVASGALATPVAGLAGLGKLALSGGDLKYATEAIEGTQQALTYEPKTEKGQQYLQNVGEVLEPIGEAIESTGETLGDVTREATGSWVLGGLAQSIPEAALELVGVKGAGKLVKPKATIARKPKAALSQSAPEIKQLRQAASDTYNQINEMGVRVPKSDYMDLGVKLNNVARQSGYDANLTPKVKGFLERVQNDYKKGELKITDIDQLRKVAQIPANAIDNATEAAIGSKMIGVIDDFLDQQGVKISKDYGGDVGKMYRSARELTSRVKKAEVLDEAVFKAAEAASGFENGLRNEIRSILRNKKRRRGFNKDELEAMRQITQGGTMENIFKKLGKLGFGADQQTNMLLGTLGFAGGFAAGGPVLGAAVPAVGYASAKIAKKLGKKNAAFMNSITRAGKNGNQITEAYLKHVPQRLQRPEELTSLLLDPATDVDNVAELGRKYKSSKKFIADTEFLLNKLRKAQAAGAIGSQAPSATQQEDE